MTNRYIIGPVWYTPIGLSTHCTRLPYWPASNTTTPNTTMVHTVILPRRLAWAGVDNSASTGRKLNAKVKASTSARVKTKPSASASGSSNATRTRNGARLVSISAAPSPAAQASQRPKPACASHSRRKGLRASTAASSMPPRHRTPPANR